MSDNDLYLAAQGLPTNSQWECILRFDQALYGPSLQRSLPSRAGVRITAVKMTREEYAAMGGKFNATTGEPVWQTYDGLPICVKPLMEGAAS